MSRTPVFLVVLAAVTGSCAKPTPTQVSSSADATEGKPPPEIRVTASRTDLVFSYLVAGRWQTATTISSIPEDARQQVIVTDLSLSPAERQSERYVYIVDLREPRADGAYPVAVASRYGFEKSAAGTTVGPAAAGATKQVIVYTTSWCGVCKRAKRFLGKLGVAFVEKDIEGSQKAAAELAQKSQAAGLQGGGVPVIDVAGTLLQGLDESTLESVLKQKGLL